jgi:ATP-binding cassette, subfamily B, bacterial MsbA
MHDYRKLFPYLRPHLGLLALAAVCMLFSSLLGGVELGMLVPMVDLVILNKTMTLPAWVPEPVIQGVDQVQSMGRLAKLHAVAIGVAVLFLLKHFTVFAQTVLMNDTALRFLRDMRAALYRQYHRLSLNFFTGRRTGELVSRVTYDVSVLQNTIIEGLTDLIYQTSQVVILTTIVFAIHWKLALVTLVLFPAIAYPIIRIGKVLRKLSVIAQERMADINSRLIETIQGVRIIRAFTAERSEKQRFINANHQFYKANIRTVKRREALASITGLIGALGSLVVLEIGGRVVFGNQLSEGTFIYFLAALISLTRPLKKLSRLYALHQQALIAANRVVRLLETPPSVKEKKKAVQAQAFSKEICFEKVWFRYEKQDVLRGIDLKVKAGEVVAIVGSSGSGKTTLVNLLLRFYDPTRGRITLDGVDLKELSLHSLREQMGLVTQDPFLFHESVHSNISFGHPEAPPAGVVQAAKVANADRFIKKLPKKYDTLVGEMGFKISGGERQRIAIARAVFKDPPILILDEATSQLDSESEALVQEALDRLMQGRTALVVAHRLSTIRRADRIVVLDKGKIAEVGRHEELLEGSEVYRRLYQLQAM